MVVESVLRGQRSQLRNGVRPVDDAVGHGKPRDSLGVRRVLCLECNMEGARPALDSAPQTSAGLGSAAARYRNCFASRVYRCATASPLTTAALACAINRD